MKNKQAIIEINRYNLDIIDSSVRFRVYYDKASDIFEIAKYGSDCVHMLDINKTFTVPVCNHSYTGVLAPGSEPTLTTLNLNCEFLVGANEWTNLRCVSLWTLHPEELEMICNYIDYINPEFIEIEHKITLNGDFHLTFKFQVETFHESGFVSLQKFNQKEIKYNPPLSPKDLYEKTRGEHYE